MTEKFEVKNLLVSERPGRQQHLFDAVTKTAICGRKDFLNDPQPANAEFSIIWCRNCAAKVGA